jgi:hypothetical protein
MKTREFQIGISLSACQDSPSRFCLLAKTQSQNTETDTAVFTMTRVSILVYKYYLRAETCQSQQFRQVSTLS